MKYIFEVRIKTGYSAEQYADAWVRASRIIQQTPGARGTELHRKLDDPNLLIAIASWDSKADRDAMENKHNSTVADIIRGAAHFCEIPPVGEFDEPDWMVRPPASDTQQSGT